MAKRRTQPTAAAPHMALPVTVTAPGQYRLDRTALPRRWVSVEHPDILRVEFVQIAPAAWRPYSCIFSKRADDGSRTYWAVS